MIWCVIYYGVVVGGWHTHAPLGGAWVCVAALTSPRHASHPCHPSLDHAKEGWWVVVVMVVVV